jgi:PAS domain S-box-containing protein
VAPSMAQQQPGGAGVLQYKHTAPWSAPIGGGGGNGDDSGGEMNDKTVAERRERNREHAKRSRVRKKFMLESLQEQVRGLQQENKGLRMLVQEHIPDKAVQIFAECCTQNVLFADDGSSASVAQDAQDNLDRKDFALMRALSNGQRCFVLSDPKLPDNPIIFASPGFYKMTGYTDKEVLGRNCRFLQGEGTDPKSVELIRKAVAAGSDMTVCMLNYKADGSPFWNQFFVAALRDSDNNIVNYVRVLFVSLWK